MNDVSVYSCIRARIAQHAWLRYNQLITVKARGVKFKEKILYVNYQVRSVDLVMESCTLDFIRLVY